MKTLSERPARQQPAPFFRTGALSMNRKVGQASRLPPSANPTSTLNPLALEHSQGRRDACPTLVTTKSIGPKRIQNLTPGVPMDRPAGRPVLACAGPRTPIHGRETAADLETTAATRPVNLPTPNRDSGLRFQTLRRRSLLRSLTLFLLLWTLCPDLTRAGDVSADFEQANKSYEQGNFTEAAAAYVRMIEGGQVSPAIYFNLGNALFKSGQIGRAIFNFRLAQLLAPRDPDVRANLRFARNQVEGAQTQPAVGWRRLTSHLTLNEWTALATASVWLWFALLALTQWRPALKKSLRGYTATTGVGASMLTACLALACYDRFGLTSAIVVAREAVVRFGPLDESSSFYTVRDGAELKVLDSKGDWLQVTDRSRRIGWVRRGQVLLFPVAQMQPSAENSTTSHSVRAESARSENP